MPKIWRSIRQKNSFIIQKLWRSYANDVSQCYLIALARLHRICTVGIYRVAQKVSHYQSIKNCIKSYSSLSMRLYVLVKLKYQSCTIILFVGIRYSMRDLRSHFNNYAGPAN